MKFYAIVIALLISIYTVAGEEEWTKYNGHGMAFEYPKTWGLVDGPTGVVVTDNQTFALSIVMHPEGCYPLLQHPQIMDFMLKFWGTKMDGSPDGDPITQYIEQVLVHLR
jgi:hypothetical protein